MVFGFLTLGFLVEVGFLGALVGFGDLGVVASDLTAVRLGVAVPSGSLTVSSVAGAIFVADIATSGGGVVALRVILSDVVSSLVVEVTCVVGLV